MRSGTAKGNEYYSPWTTVHQLTTKRRRDANQIARAKFMVLPLNDQREAALQHEKHLLLALVRVDPSALSRLEHDLVQTECGHAKLTPKREETLAGLRIEPSPSDAVFHRSSSCHRPARSRASRRTNADVSPPPAADALTAPKG